MNRRCSDGAIPVTINDRESLVVQEDPLVAERKQKKQAASATARKRKKAEEAMIAKKVKELEEQLQIERSKRERNYSLPSDSFNNVVNKHSTAMLPPTYPAHQLQREPTVPSNRERTSYCTGMQHGTPASNVPPSEKTGEAVPPLPIAVAGHPIVREVVGQLQGPATPGNNTRTIQPVPLPSNNLGQHPCTVQCSDYTDAGVITWALVTIKKLRSLLFDDGKPNGFYHCMTKKQPFSMLITVVQCFVCDNIPGCKMKKNTVKILPTVMKIAMDCRYNVDDPALTGILTSALEKAPPCSCDEARRQRDEYKDELSKYQEMLQQIYQTVFEPNQEEERMNAYQEVQQTSSFHPAY